MLRFVLTLMLVASIAKGGNLKLGGVKYPFRDPTLPWEIRVDDLVSRLTLEEIVPQTLALYGSGEGGYTPPIPRLGILPYVWVAECSHGEPGTNTTAFPQSLALAASFNSQLIFNVSEAIANSVRAHWNGLRKQGIYIANIGLTCLSPVINIMRHPLWGRNQETYGEDPYLAGKLVQSYVRGLQGSHPRYVRADAGCKHFDVHGGPDEYPVSRFSFNAKVSVRDWRMTFLPQFKMCVDAGVVNLMCSFNGINGIPACANEELLTNITRKEWGFTGFIISDSGAIPDTINQHKYFKTNAEAASGCIRAGCNLELSVPSYTSYQAQLDALKQGLITEKQLRDNVRPLMYARLRHGEFDPEEMNPYNFINMSVVQTVEIRELAVVAAMQSFVLLKNLNNFLPITKRYNKVAIVGPFAVNPYQFFGDYSSWMVRQFTTSLYDGLIKLAASVNLGPGCSDAQCDSYNASQVKQAIVGAEIVFVALGTGIAIEMEQKDRTNIDLPGQQLQILQDAACEASGKPIVLLLFNGGPLDITWAKMSGSVTAILECFFPGQATGEAIYRTLTVSGGRWSVPAARLPATWPSNINQVPPITNYDMNGHTYRYYNGDPLYPFGYGLSYTTFQYTSMTVRPTTIVGGQNVTVTVGVMNIGSIEADEVVQVYLVWPEGSSIPVPKIQLVAFDRVGLKAGEHKVLDLLVTNERMAVWGDNAWTYIKGVTTVYGGGQQPRQKMQVNSNILTAQFTVQ